MDPLEFFDYLAKNTTTTAVSTPLQHENDYVEEWNELLFPFKQEKQNLQQIIASQFQALKELDDTHEKDNIVLNDRMYQSYDTLSDDIHNHQTRLMTEKEQYEKEKVWITKVRRQQDEKVKLNVGGQLFETSLSTLRKDPNSILAYMFGEPKTVKPDADNSYFIDRDGTYFRLVLNYLRDLKIPTGVANDPKIMDELMQEARFYKIADLLKLKWQRLPILTQQELHDLYPLPSNPSSYQPVIFNLSKRNLANLDFSGYHIDPRSDFSHSNLENARFDCTRFGFDFDHRVNYRNAYLVGATFPEKGTEYRGSGIDFLLDGAIVNEHDLFT